MSSWRQLAIRLSKLAGGVLLAAAAVVAQEPQPPDNTVTSNGQSAQPSEQQQAAQAALEAQALKLLEQTVSEAQALRLPENRLRVQSTAADMLWAHDEGRARSLFNEAAAGLGALVRSLENNNRQQYGSVWQLRQELLTVMAQRDPALALDTLRATRLPEQAQNNFRRGGEADANLEFRLLAMLAASDPRQALQKAQEMLSKGEYSGSLVNLLAQLQTKDKDAAAKLTEDMLKSLRAENMTTNQSARNLSLALLQAGPRPATVTTGEQKASGNNQTTNQVLSEAAYRELLETLISTALSIVPQPPQTSTTATTATTTTGPRGGGGGGRGGNIGLRFNIGGRGEANGMLLLAGVGSLLPQIDKYAPARASLVRQKLSGAGINTEQQTAVREQLNALTQQASVDTMLSAAGQAPPGLQTRLYQQAALKAVDEGNTDRARQIATEHLNADMRERVLQAVERQQVVRAAAQGRTAEAEQMLARLPSDADRVEALLQIAALLVEQGAQKPAGQMLDDARNLVARRAENYPQLEAQLRVAHAYAAVEPARSFELLEPGIGQINELLNAAALLNGFEGNFFKDGELPLRGNTSLSSIIAEYAQELATLARVDFAGAQLTADKFQRLEPRIVAKLAIARGVLGGNANQPPAFSPTNRRFSRRGN